MIERLDKIFSVFAALARDGFSWQELVMYGLTLTAIVLIVWLSLEVIKKLLDIIYQIINIVKIPIEAIERVLIRLFSGIGKVCSSIPKFAPVHQQPPE
jgi:hypothetical protein